MKAVDTGGDLNFVALHQFRELIAADNELTPAWREALLELTANGVPQETASLDRFLESELHAPAEEAQS